jgi:hypothetical protein
MVVVLLKEMSRDSEVREKLLILAMTISASIPWLYLVRRIYTTSSIVRRPMGPPVCPLRPAQQVGLLHS